MKLVTWNCQGAYRKKAQWIAALQPDIAVIQECEPLHKLIFPSDCPRPNDCLWFGDGKKGIGIFSYSDYTFQVHEVYNPSIRHCVPLQVQGQTPCHLIAVWTMPDPVRYLSYISQLYLAIQEYRPFIRAADTLLVGDLNSNAIWDNGAPKYANHSHVVKELSNEAIVSVYHEYFQEEQGKETTKTFFLYRQRERGYHIDYCFSPRSWLERLTQVSVGNFDTWIRRSDHCPLIIEFN